MTGSARLDPARRFEVACAIAGILAEIGQTRLTLHRANQQTTCEARSTDLPALLSEGALDLLGDGVRIRFAADSVQWDTRGEELAREIAAACA